MVDDLYSWLGNNDPVRKLQNTNILGQSTGSYLAPQQIGTSGNQNAYLPSVGKNDYLPAGSTPGIPRPGYNPQGVKWGFKVPDMWQQGQVPTLAQDHTLATTKYNPVADPGQGTGNPIPPNGRPVYTALGDVGPTAAHNFDTGMAPPATINSNLTISPTGQYQTQTQAMQPQQQQTQQQSGGALASYISHVPNKTYKKAGSKPNYFDSEYLSDTRNIDKALADYRAKLAIQKTRAGTDYAVSNRDLTQTKQQDLKNIADDFAARGIINSGVYGQKLGDYNQQWGNQSSDLLRKYNQAKQDIATQLTDYVRQAQQQKDAARFAAIRRRAQKLGKI